MSKHAQPEATRRLQITLLTFFVLAALSFVVIYSVAPAIYVQTLLLAPQPGTSHPLAVTLFLVAILAFVTLLAISVLKQWRWVFWLILVAFGLSIVVIPRCSVCIGAMGSGLRVSRRADRRVRRAVSSRQTMGRAHLSHPWLSVTRGGSHHAPGFYRQDRHSRRSG